MLNRGYAFRAIIRREDEGSTLLAHLARLYGHSSAEVWQAKLDADEVTLDGVAAAGSERLVAGQTLVWSRPPWVEPDAPLHFDVLWEDAHLLAVNKPGGLPTLPGGGFMENTLLHLVQAQRPGANPVHRLGRGTTGIVVFAKTAQAAATLSADWNTARIQKIYRALAQGVAPLQVCEILTPIGLVPHPRLGSVWAARADGKPSKSVVRVLSRSADATTFEIALHSGRPHQIRIHLASIGHPLVGDPLYGVGGVPLQHLPGLPGEGGYRLHAHRLRFLHPGYWRSHRAGSSFAARFRPCPGRVKHRETARKPFFRGDFLEPGLSRAKAGVLLKSTDRRLAGWVNDPGSGMA